MFSDWLIFTGLICLCIYLVVMLFYYKTLLRKEKISKDFIKNTLDDTEVVLRKQQAQLQRSLGNIDLLTDELDKIKSDLTNLRTRNSQYRLENSKLNSKIKELEAKIESLL